MHSVLGYLLIAFSTVEMHNHPITRDIVLKKFKTEEECVMFYVDEENVKFFKDRGIDTDNVLCAPYSSNTIL